MSTTHTPTRETPGPLHQGTPSENGVGPPPASHRRRWPLLLAALLTAGLGVAGWFVAARESEETTPLVLEGNIDVRQVDLAFKVAGRIESLAVDEGDTVKTGEVLATLDRKYFLDDLRLARARRDNAAANLLRLEHGSRPEEIAQARALVQERKAALEAERVIYPRMRQLLKTQAVSQDDVDREESALRVAEARLKQAQESLRLAELGPRQEDIAAARAQLSEQEEAVVQAERRLADSELIAPGDGVILTRARERGAIVAAGETIFTLTLTSPVWVRTYVSERDLGLIQPGLAATVTTDSAPGRPYSGHVGFISPTAEFTPKAVETRELRTDLVYRVRVVVDNPDGGLRQGMPVTVTLPVSRSRPRTFWQRLWDGLPFQHRSGGGG